MTLEEREAFIEGKKAEVASIFENGVWEVEAVPQKVDHARVMRARFVPKGTTDAKGKPRAKGRLVRSPTQISSVVGWIPPLQR